MKLTNKIQGNVLIAVIILFIALSGYKSKSKKQSPVELEGSISISGAFALYPMVIKWAEEYKKLHPKVRFDISAGGAGKGISDVLGGLIDLGAVSRDIYPEEIRKGAYPIAVTKDAVVATVNSSNPNIKNILAMGLKKETFSKIFASGTYKNWQQAGYPISAPIHIYTRSDAAGAAETWAKYLGINQEDLLGIGVFGDPGLLLAVKNDPLGIGYNNIAYAFDPKTKKQIQGIAIVPIDINENGKIDLEENFYYSKEVLIQAIKTGKYPSPPARNLYLVSKNKPQKKVLVDFLKWVLTKGQKYVNESEYIELPKEKLELELGKI